MTLCHGDRNLRELILWETTPRSLSPGGWKESGKRGPSRTDLFWLHVACWASRATKSDGRVGISHDPLALRSPQSRALLQFPVYSYKVQLPAPARATALLLSARPSVVMKPFLSSSHSRPFPPVRSSLLVTSHVPVTVGLSRYALPESSVSMRRTTFFLASNDGYFPFKAPNATGCVCDDRFNLQHLQGAIGDAGSHFLHFDPNLLAGPGNTDFDGQTFCLHLRPGSQPSRWNKM